YMLERQTIFNSLSDAISKNITNYEELKELVPRLDDICKAYYADKGIPKDLETEKVFRYFRMIWKDDSYFRKVENREDKDEKGTCETQLVDRGDYT
ncbi:MAG: hypothetical protein EB127_12335, partial [Alphaproteobacteria bacterium]|nr:hypothetical protein [Alphaproteobacteria bacterium]